MVLGLAAGVVLRQQWWVGAIPCAVGFLFATDLYLMLVEQLDPVSEYGWSNYLNTLLYRLPAVGLMLSAAFFTSRYGPRQSLEIPPSQ